MAGNVSTFDLKIPRLHPQPPKRESVKPRMAKATTSWLTTTVDSRRFLHSCRHPNAVADALLDCKVNARALEHSKLALWVRQLRSRTDSARCSCTT